MIVSVWVRPHTLLPCSSVTTRKGQVVKKLCSHPHRNWVQVATPPVVAVTSQTTAEEHVVLPRTPGKQFYRLTKL